MSSVVNSSRRLVLSLTLSAVAASVLALTGCSEPKAAFKGVDITGADYAKELNLPDQNGQARKIKDFSGKLVVVFFGYTQCPDVCPTTMQELAEVKRLLGADGDKLQAVFVTVDPERDTPALLKDYAAYFHPEMIGAVGSKDEINAIAKAFKAGYVRQATRPDGSYAVDHSAHTYVIGPNGKLADILPTGTPTDRVVTTIRKLL